MMPEILKYIESLFEGWTLSTGGLSLVFLGLFLVSSWSICFVGAFCRVKRTPMYVAMLSVGLAVLVSLILAGLTKGFFPDLANEFTPWGLLIVSFLLTSLVFSVPLVQCFWRTSYPQGFFCLAGGFGLLLLAMVTVQMTLQPVKSMSARPTIPIFSESP